MGEITSQVGVQRGDKRHAATPEGIYFMGRTIVRLFCGSIERESHCHINSTIIITVGSRAHLPALLSVSRLLLLLPGEPLFKFRATQFDTINALHAAVIK